MASDSSAEADLSGTSVVAYSAVADGAGGQRFVLSGGGVSLTSVGGAFKNYDGLGRLLRVRYDTPAFHGLSFRASAGRNAVAGSDETEWDLAAAYNRSIDSFEVGAGAAFSRPGGDRDRFSGSISALHTPTGLNLTFAAASDERPGGTDASYVYGKIGWRADIFDFGGTAFSADYYGGDDIVDDGSDSTSWGVAVVQSAPAWQTDFYATLRVYEYDDSASYEDGLAVLFGARFSF